MNPEVNASVSCPAWKIWGNPIVRRYARSRLRPQSLALWLSVILLVAGFMFFAIRTGFMYRGNLLPVDAERTPLLPLLAFQGLILFFMGVGQSVSGIIAEAEEGVIDYQRLQPMSPLAKLTGFWFGLPVREWLLFASTLPFTAWCLWRGQVPFHAWSSVYGVLITSALMYHVTALAAGTVIKNRRSATLVSMFVLTMLYTVMPNIAKAGLIFFDYLTLWPVLNENLPHFLPREAGDVTRVLQLLDPQVKFYGLELDTVFFTLVCQGGVMLTFGTMLWRRWRRTDSHLLGKSWAVGVFAWIQVLLLGNALPLIEPGGIFPSQVFGRRFRGHRHDIEPTLSEGIALIGIYGLISLLIALVLIFLITPSPDVHERGLRRARKLRLPRVPVFTDAAGALPFVAAIVLIGTVGWTLFAQAMMSSKWFPGHALPNYAPLVLFLVLSNAMLAYHIILEGWGVKRLFICVIGIGIVPPLVGSILAMMHNSLHPLAIWLNAASPGYAPIAAAGVLVPGMEADIPLQVRRAVPLSFVFFQGLMLLVTIWLLVSLRRVHQTRRNKLG